MVVATALPSRRTAIERDQHRAHLPRKLAHRIAHWSTLQRLAATLGPSVLVLLFAGLVYLGLDRQAASRARVAHAHHVIEAVDLVLARLTDAETGQRGYLLSDRARYLEPYVAAEHNAEQQLATLALLAKDHPEQSGRLDTLAALSRAKFAELDTTVGLERNGDRAAALAVLDSDRGKRIMDDARRVAAAMQQAEIDLLATSGARERRIASLVRWILVVGALLAVVVALLINTLLARHAATQERSARELDAQNGRLEQQTLELEFQNQQLQEQAAEVETQQQHLQDQAAELEAQTEELAAINVEIERTAEELRFGQERLRLALGAGRLGPWEWDIVTGVVTWSPAVEAMHGLAPGTFPGTFEAYQLDIHPDDRERVLSAIGAVVAERAPHYLRYRIVRADGDVRWLEAHGALMFDAAGHPARLVGVCGDITEREAERAAAETARRAAEAANAAKSEFLATMSHELRTPLNAISGYVDLLTMELRGPVTDAQREDLTRIKKSGQHLLSLINDILNMARIESGRLELDVTDVPLKEVLENVEALMAPQMQAKRLTYRNVHADATITARADAEKLQQILLNLLTNACKFTAAGGRVGIDCERMPNASPRDGGGGGARDGAGAVVVRVRDTGRGIPAEKLASVFEPFVQIDRQSTHESQQGVGLGLAISRDLARAMGGELTAESIVGEGSTFTLTLPCGPRSRLEHADERPRAGLRAEVGDGQ